MKSTHITLLIIVVIIFIMGYLNLNIKDEYKASRENFISFQKSAKEIYSIKRMKKDKMRVIAKLKRIKNPKVREKSLSTIYTFENLNLYQLNRLLKKIKGSYLIVKHLRIERDATNHATVIVEVEK